jgi:hypothetical protein
MKELKMNKTAKGHDLRQDLKDQKVDKIVAYMAKLSETNRREKVEQLRQMGIGVNMAITTINAHVDQKVDLGVSAVNSHTSDEVRDLKRDTNACFHHLCNELGVPMLANTSSISSSSSSGDIVAGSKTHAVQTHVQQPPFATTRVLILFLFIFIFGDSCF